MREFFLADDLSGALDAAGAFHRAGQAVTIALTLEAWPAARAGQIVGFTTETRNATAAAAAEAVTRAIAHGTAQGGRLVYKKIDSTLRGPVAAELAALQRALPGTRILFTPANPGVGRTVREGVLLVNGVPVAETEFARDPVSPVRQSAIAKLLGAAATASVVIADTESENDLSAAVTSFAAGPGPWVAVGSGALARPVARQRARGQSGAPSTAAPAALQPVPDVGVAGTTACLFLCGSAHPRNREQVAVLARERQVTVHEFRPADSEATTAAVVAALRAARSVALVIEAARGDSALVVRSLAAVAGCAVRDAGVRRLFITGGETAFAVCGELGVAALDFEREVESGLCVARAELPGGGGVRLAIKPGGFGGPATWVRAGDALRE